jgi:hypothetical protein
MKSQHKNIKVSKPKNSLNFPLLALCKDVVIKSQNFIVLFSAPQVGMVVYSQLADRPIGDYSDSWVPCHDESSWEILPSTEEIILANSL